MSSLVSLKSTASASGNKEWAQIPFLHFPILLSAVSVLYFIAAKIGIATQLPPNGIVTVWPANAVVLVSILLVPRNKWWLICVATVTTELLADVPAGYPVWAAAGYGIVNFSEAALAAVLLLTLSQGSPALISLRDFLTFLATGPLLASATAALFGAALYKIGSPEVDYFHYWRVFWFGDALGLIILGTALLSLRRPQVWQSRPTAYLVLEASTLAAGMVFSAFFAFFTVSQAPRIYWVFPFLIWAALRFGVYGASAAVLATVVIAVWSAASGVGPFVTLLNVDLVTSLQGLILVVAISTFLLAFSVEDFLRISRELRLEVAQRKAAQAESYEINQSLEQINRSLDQIVSDRTKELRSSLEQNKVLLGELKHRIKNNLQIISSLTGFHTRSVHDEAAKERLSILQGQITAMATTYDLLHQNDSTQFVDFCKIVPPLCRNISDACGELVSISTDTSGETLVSSEAAVALSLVLNELITNSIKHASGEVSISVVCHPADEQILLRITDDGPGFPPDFDLARATGFGLRMIRALIEQVQGNWHLIPTERGSTVEIHVPNTPGKSESV